MKNRYLGLICLLYSLIIGFVFRYNILGNFLAPSMHIYIISTMILLLLMGLIICFSEKFRYNFKLSDLVLILPLIFLVFAGDGRLTLNYSNNKMLKMESNKKVNSKDLKLEEERKEKEKEVEKKIKNNEYDFTKPFFDVNDKNYYDLANNISYIAKPDKFIGKTIKVRGFSMTDNENIPKKYFLIGKYGVSCCAADAGMLGFIIEYNNYKIKNNKWYEVEGVLTASKDLGGFDIMVIKIVNIKEIDEKNEEQYVYPCYTYGEDNCKNILDYEFEN